MIRPDAQRAPRTLPEHLTASGFATGVGAAVLFALIASLAVSRANGNLLSATALVAVVVGAAVALDATGWVNGLYGGAGDVLDGRVQAETDPAAPASPASVDPWRPSRLWRASATAALAAGTWAGATAGLVAVVLDAGRAPFLVVFATLVGTVALTAAVVDIAARHRGARVALALTSAGAATVPAALRRRAWRDIAVPIGVLQFVVNAGAAWLLFHDYGKGSTDPLTASVATSDLGVVVIIIVGYFGVTAARWGAIEAGLGRVGAEDPGLRSADRRTIGPQLLVYIALAAMLLGKMVGFLLPEHPSLVTVALARGIFAGLVATAATAAGLVRGAVNASVASEDRLSPSEVVS